jgi:hypothetical protein
MVLTTVSLSGFRPLSRSDPGTIDKDGDDGTFVELIENRGNSLVVCWFVSFTLFCLSEWLIRLILGFMWLLPVFSGLFFFLRYLVLPRHLLPLCR